jgi:hypothetical protein
VYFLCHELIRTGHAGSGERPNRYAVLVDGHSAVENIAAAVSGDVVCLCEFKGGWVALDGLILKNLLNQPMAVSEQCSLVSRWAIQRP